MSAMSAMTTLQSPITELVPQDPLFAQQRLDGMFGHGPGFPFAQQVLTRGGRPKGASFGLCAAWLQRVLTPSLRPAGLGYDAETSVFGDLDREALQWTLERVAAVDKLLEDAIHAGTLRSRSLSEDFPGSVAEAYRFRQNERFQFLWEEAASLLQIDRTIAVPLEITVSECKARRDRTESVPGAVAWRQGVAPFVRANAGLLQLAQAERLHTIAWWRDSTSAWICFDPNFGEYRCTRVGQFQELFVHAWNEAYRPTGFQPLRHVAFNLR